MGYSTDFGGNFKLNKEPDEKVKAILKGLSSTRRMKRNVNEALYGIEGEFYFKDDGNFGQSDDETIVEYNQPPATQPSLWCQWILAQDGEEWTIEWDGNEKFYNYIEWIKYIIDRVLKPSDLSLSGEVCWYGEDREDMGKIIIEDNQIKILNGEINYKE